MATTVLTSRNHAISLTVANVAIPGFWKTFEGGGLSAETTINRPGGMADRVVIASTAERDNVTLGRDYDWVRDGALIGPGGYLDAQVEEGGAATVTVQKLNQQRQPVGAATVYRGVIAAANPPEWDSEGTDTQMYTIEIAVEN